ncbi:hypothetical protein HG530_011514 [Fusarium avenaceum]|nr:hypothetical protein HG530_011514 [Fusarium avenaceum]
MFWIGAFLELAGLCGNPNILVPLLVFKIHATAVVQLGLLEIIRDWRVHAAIIEILEDGHVGDDVVDMRKSESLSLDEDLHQDVGAHGYFVFNVIFVEESINVPDATPLFCFIVNETE